MLTPRTKKRILCNNIFFFKSFKMNVVDELINELQNTLNKLINKNDLDDETTELSNELLETLKVLENCKDKYGINLMNR